MRPPTTLALRCLRPRRLRLRNRRLVDVVIEFASVSEGRERESGDIEVGRVGPDRVLPRFRWR